MPDLSLILICYLVGFGLISILNLILFYKLDSTSKVPFFVPFSRGINKNRSKYRAMDKKLIFRARVIFNVILVVIILAIPFTNAIYSFLGVI